MSTYIVPGAVLCTPHSARDSLGPPITVRRPPSHFTDELPRLGSHQAACPRPLSRRVAPPGFEPGQSKPQPEQSGAKLSEGINRPSEGTQAFRKARCGGECGPQDLFRPRMGIAAARRRPASAWSVTQGLPVTPTPGPSSWLSAQEVQLSTRTVAASVRQRSRGSLSAKGNRSSRAPVCQRLLSGPQFPHRRQKGGLGDDWDPSALQLGASLHVCMNLTIF